jgi:electron transfer flavoprotein beta subunit
MKAKKKPLEVIEYDSLGLDISSRLEVLNVEEPVSSHNNVVMVSSIDELLDRLKNEAKVDI